MKRAALDDENGAVPFVEAQDSRIAISDSSTFQLGECWLAYSDHRGKNLKVAGYKSARQSTSRMARTYRLGRPS
jgi:hypothetical protein